MAFIYGYRFIIAMLCFCTSGAVHEIRINDSLFSNHVHGGRNVNTRLPPIMDRPVPVVDGGNSNKNNENVTKNLISGSPQRPVQHPQLQPPVDYSKCLGCRCGLNHKANKIVGGVETKVNAYPWMVHLTNTSGFFFCGATVINDRYLLTAAHCVRFPNERILATFLDHDRSTPLETRSFTREVIGYLKHPSYGVGGSANNDLALLKVNGVLDFSGLLKPVCLPPAGESFARYNGIVTGWGVVEGLNKVSNVLREVQVPIMSNIECIRTGYGREITDNMMCAGYRQGTKDACQGDSGGPMHVVLNETYYNIVGVVSWGIGCARPNYPGVYARVNRYLSWIRDNTRDACYC